jgi:hypothetical protein
MFCLSLLDHIMDLTLGMVSLRFYLNISQDNQELILHKYPYNISDKLVSF